MWDIIVIFALILVSVVVTFIMARTSKPTIISIKLDDEFKKDLAATIGAAIKEALSDINIVTSTTSTGFSKSSGQQAHNLVEMNESVIPTNVNVDNVEGANLEGMAKEEVNEDKDLASSKSKLAGIFKKKGKK